MGTDAGAFYLSRRHGFAPAPTAEKTNRWIRSLRSATEVGVSPNSEIRSSSKTEGQESRCATVDISKGDVVLDFKVVMKGAKSRSVDTLQLGEGYFFKSTGGPLRFKHHCTPNCHLCFEDLTFRALRDI